MLLSFIKLSVAEVSETDIQRSKSGLAELAELTDKEKKRKNEKGKLETVEEASELKVSVRSQTSFY